MTVVFATCDHQPLTAADDAPLADALKALGLAVIPIPWTEIDPYTVIGADPIVLRSTWDYHRVPTLFAAWLDGFADSGRLILNPADVARGNIDKIYLQALEAAGIEIPRTRWLTKPDQGTLVDVLRDEGWDRAVLKPRIGATAYGMCLISMAADLSETDLGPAQSSGALVQEFIPEILDRGEISMVYAGRDFSHAVLKRAKAGDFRVQKDFGGTVQPIVPSAAALAFGDKVMAQVAPSCAYARVDVVEADRGPLLMELELIEPELYLTIVAGAAERLARQIAARIS